MCVFDCKFMFLANSSVGIWGVDLSLHFFREKCIPSCNHLWLLTLWDFNQILLLRYLLPTDNVNWATNPHKDQLGDQLGAMKSQGNVCVFYFPLSFSAVPT